MEHELDDTHLCIKCSRTIVGLENYIEHRKKSCSGATKSSHASNTKIPSSTTPTRQEQRAEVTPQVTPAITYEPFNFNEPEPSNPVSHGGKTSKSLAESYDLPYELEADVFFSSLQLQSVQSVPSTSGGKTASNQQQTRQKSLQQETSTEETWISAQASGAPNRSDEQFLKTVVSDMGATKNKSYDTLFKYEHESPEVSEDEEDDEGDAEMDDDDEDYDPMAEAHSSGGKWKLSLMRHSPPVVPASHTGGKWRPEHRPNLRVAHTQLSRASPSWDDIDGPEGQHPPSDHTKGKWIPGTKMQRLEYKEVVELAKCSTANQDYWCNICCRKLKSKIIYENHLKTSYHIKRAEPELQLEKAVIEQLPKEDIKKSFSLVEIKPSSLTSSINTKKRKRRCTYLKCSLCKHVMTRHLIGKHLISHYHYRRMQLHPGNSLQMILDNIHAIVLQSPFQCRSCHFYANTEEAFLLHWNSASHLDSSEGPGRFWCSYCQFECEDNNQMRRHLLGPEHKEVLLAINRSVPICIIKRLSIDCPVCGQIFRFNFELGRHILNFHGDIEPKGTASDAYQSKFRCNSCPEVLLSKVALQRHEKFKHFISKYFCSICTLEFNSPCKARRHRKTLEHKQNAFAVNQKAIEKEEAKKLFKLKIGKSKLSSKPTSSDNVLKLDEKLSTSAQAIQKVSRQTSPSPAVEKTFNCKNCSFTCNLKDELKLHCHKEHLNLQHMCILCSKNFTTAQELGRHSRVCKPTTVVAPEEVKQTSQLTESITEKGEKIWQCNLCKFRTPFHSELIYHRVFHSYSSVSKNQLLPCPLCDKALRKQSLRFHLHNHTKEKLFKCDICNTSFSRPHNLKDHIKNIHRDGRKVPGKTPETAVDAKVAEGVNKMFPCSSCQKVFKSKHSMKLHHLTHHVSEERHLYKCTFESCDYTSVSKSLLKVHLNSHSNESFKCTSHDCKYVGKSKLHLRRHLLTHTTDAEAKQFSCDQCPFKTKIKSHLKRHHRQHTEEKPYSCPHCDFRCRTLENLRKHILKTEKHVGKFVFECQKCKEDLANGEKQQENKAKEIFKTNSHQKYQQHLKSQHKADVLIT